MKKYIIIFLLTIGASGLFIGCGSNSELAGGTKIGNPKAAPGTITGQLAYPEGSAAVSLKKYGPARAGKETKNVKVRLENSSLSTYTDTNGDFEITGVPPGKHTIVAEYSDGLKVRVNDITVTDEEGDSIGTVNMQTTGKIAGIIQIRGRNDFSGINVFIPGTSLGTLTDDKGYFLIDGIPKTVGRGNSIAEKYSVAVGKTGYESYKFENIEVLPGKTTFIDTVIVLDTAVVTGSLTGKVILEGVTDYSGAIVSIENTRYADTTNSSGSFTITGIPAGTYRLKTVKTDYISVSIDYIPVTEEINSNLFIIFLTKKEKPDLDGDGRTDDIDEDDDNDGFSDLFETQSGTDPKNPFSYPKGSLKGYVTPATTNAIVYARLNGIKQGFDIIDEKGSYQIDNLPSGTYALVIKATGYDLAETDNIRVSAGYITQVQETPLKPTVKTGNISGRVSLYAEAVNEGITVTVQGTTQQVTSGLSGEFTVEGLNEGFYTLVFSYLDYLEKVIYNVIVQGEETTRLSPVTLIPVQGIGGILTGTVEILNADRNGGAIVVLEGSDKIAVTAGSGYYRITDITAGTYTVTVMKLNYNETSAEINITSAQTTEQNFILTPVITADMDNDGIPDHLDADRDGDGVLNADDIFPSDSSEWSDLDGDSIGDNSDIDMDNDGFTNSADAFPKDRTEWLDTDGDGIGDNRDADDDNDGFTDIEETDYGSDPKDIYSKPVNILSLITDENTVKQNYIFEVKVYLKSVTNLMSGEIKIEYDSTKLGIDSDTAGAFLSLNNAYVFYQSVSGNDSMTITFSALEGDPAGVTGSGVLAVIRFTALEKAEELQLKIADDYKLRTPDNNAINVNTVDLHITIE